MKSLTALLLPLAVVMTSTASAAESVHEFTMRSLKGQEVDFSQYKDKVLLIVNTASKCGLTGQYEQLQAMHEKYKDQGLVILGFPCNQFGKQEPGSDADISEFCLENYGVEFPMFSKIDVNGKDSAAIYKYLKAEAPLEDDGKKKGNDKDDIRWNFEKFVIGKDGKVAGRFHPRTKPDAEEVITLIDKELAE